MGGAVLKLLLDTHIWIWSIVEPARLVPRVAKALAAPTSELWLSPFSLWEASMLVERRRIDVEGDSDTWISRALAAAPFREAPFSFEIAAVSREIALPHQDPVDRFLAATARVLGLRLVTADERLHACAGIEVLANRAR